MTQQPTIQLPTNFDQLDKFRRFFILGTLEEAHKLHLLLAGRYSDRFFGFFWNDSHQKYDDTTMFCIRPIKEYVDQLGEGDCLFLCQRNRELEPELAERGVTLAYPNNLVIGHSTYEAPVFNLFLREHFSLDSGGGTALDIGANFGLTASMMAPYFDTVHAFEPNRVIFQNLVQNHTLPNTIKFYQMAFSDEQTVGDFYDESGMNGSLHPREQGKAYSVNIETLDGYCSREELVPKFIKIDAEGVDGKILLAAEQTIQKHKPLIFFENPAAGPHDPAELARVLEMMSEYYELTAYPVLNHLTNRDDFGIDLREFQKKYEQQPLNIGAIPKV